MVNKSELILDLDKNYFKAAKDYPILEISAKHKIGFENLYLEIKKIISEFELITTDQNESTEILKIAICGRANVGKSSFINNLIGENRVITSSVSGTTSDSIEIDWKYKNKKIKIFDTSGLNRRFALTSKSNQSLEYFSAKHTLKSIKKSMISFLILDATCDLTVQDLKIANYVLEAQKSLIIIVNKIDLIEDKRRFYKSFREILEFKIPQIKNIYLSFISAKNKYKIYSPMDLSLDVFNNFQLKIPTSKINSWIQKKIKDYPLPFAKMPGKKVKIKYLTQTCSFPLKFKVFVNLPEFITNSYKRYLLNSLVQDFSLKSIPIEMCFVKNFNPYSK
ncbi:MAG: GTP-binding protein [Rickettsia sp.]|nr:GTP-binding protein [Rickettsia sp.]